MISGCVFDASAIIDFATGKSIYMRARVRAAITDQSTVVAPAAALAAAWQAVPDHAHRVLDRIPTMTVFTVDDLDDVIAKQTGLLAAATTLDVHDAQAAWSARIRQWPLLTAQAGRYTDITRLHIEQLP